MTVPLASWRRGLTWALGLLWLLDAGLQYQPYMFTKAFPNETLKPAGDGSPAWISSPVTWSADLMAHHIVIWNGLFATGQLVIALGLFYPRTVKLALAASVAWAAMVWWLGEGLGGVFAGPVSPLMGLPGAVIIYAFIAVLVWPSTEIWQDDEARVVRRIWGVAGHGQPVARNRIEAGLAGVVGPVRVRDPPPANRAPSALHDMIAGMADGEPAWIKSIDTWGARLVDHGLATSIVLAVAFAAIAVGVYVRRGDQTPAAAGHRRVTGHVGGRPGFRRTRHRRRHRPQHRPAARAPRDSVSGRSAEQQHRRRRDHRDRVDRCYLRPMATDDVAARFLAARFLALHQPGSPLLIPNPWDAGSARVLEWLGFQALATTSSGFAMTLGRLDGERDSRGGDRSRR